MKSRVTLFVFLFSVSLRTWGQGSGVFWTPVSSPGLPPSVRLFQGDRQSPLLKAFYLDVNLNDTSIAIRPYLSTSPTGTEDITAFVQRVNAFAAINGGFFSGSSSVSTVVYPNEVRARNPASLNRSGVDYPITRSFFGVTTGRTMAVDWIYHFGNNVTDIFRFSQPTANAPGSPAPVPDTTKGSRYTDLFVGLGGGPTLVKGGQVNVTYNQEVFFGSGAGETNPDPRTAVGYTADLHAILLVADGRAAATWSEGVSLPELAQIMIELKCVEAMNLDGGGSTQMSVGGTLTNRPLGATTMRPVPTILAVVRADSLPSPKKIYFEKVIDTGDPAASLVGPGWFASANPGYWPPTAAMLNPRGSGDSYALFRLGLTRPATYDVFAWWVASSNRCTNTPFIVRRTSGTDTIRVNQTTNGSQWFRLGTFSFVGDTTETVTVSNAATAGDYVVADAIRLVSYDPSTTGIRNETMSHRASEWELFQNYPNPFNPTTSIRYRVSRTIHVRLAIFDLLGREVTRLVDGPVDAGIHSVVWDGRGVATGIYFYRLSAASDTESRVMLVVR